MTILLGDVHGDMHTVTKVCQDTTDEVISLGDLGFGKEWRYCIENLDNLKVVPGNHDDADFHSSVISLGNFGMYKGMFFIRGARSIDKHLRYQGIDWWESEELTYMQADACIEAFCDAKPDIVISHDCPWSVYPHVMRYQPVESITSVLLQTCFNAHTPKQWYFGHHHVSWQGKIKGCEFRCLNIGETLEI